MQQRVIVSRLVFGHHRIIETYVSDLEKRLAKEHLAP